MAAVYVSGLSLDPQVGVVVVRDGADVKPDVRDRCADRVERRERGNAATD